jgi:hypothetical protein
MLQPDAIPSPIMTTIEKALARFPNQPCSKPNRQTDNKRHHNPLPPNLGF